MPRQSVIPKVLSDLTEYLDCMQAEYAARPEHGRLPTLPLTPDGKINVRALAKAIGLKESQEKYLYERSELTDPINLICEGQGVLPIGSRLVQTAADAAIKERLTRQAQAATNASQAAVEAQGALQEMMESVSGMAAELESLRAENGRLRAMIEAIQEGIFVKVD
jgi:hypothetical protein